MKILLINPYKTSAEPIREYPMEPLGLISMATVMKQENNPEIEIKILDAQLGGDEEVLKTERGFRSGMSDDSIVNFFNGYKPDVVGITNNFTAYAQDSFDIAELAKKTLKCVVIIGGAHATIGHADIVKKKSIDIVVRREGEGTFKELVYCLIKKKSLAKVKGVTYKEKGKVKINPDREMLDIESLPIPDRSLVDYPKYLSKTTTSYFYTLQKPVGTLFSSRGCPFNCIFCSTQKVWSNKWRGRSAELVMKEIEYLHKDYGVKEFSFMDDQVFGNKERMVKLCNMLIEKNLKISLIVPAGISPVLIDPEIIKLMRKAGFYRICFSVDVGTVKSRNFVRKPVILEKIRGLVKAANSEGMWTYGTFVIGFPDETKEDIMETIMYAYTLKLDFILFYIAQPHLGSDLYDLYLKQGILKAEDVEKPHTVHKSLYGTKHVTVQELEELRKKAENEYPKRHAKHMINPSFAIEEFLPKISSPKKFVYFMGLLKNFTKALR